MIVSSKVFIRLSAYPAIFCLALPTKKPFNEVASIRKNSVPKAAKAALPTRLCISQTPTKMATGAIAAFLGSRFYEKKNGGKIIVEFGTRDRQTRVSESVSESEVVSENEGFSCPNPSPKF